MMPHPLMALVLATLLAGCAASRSVQLLAERTAANAGVISSHLRQLAEQSSELADRRASNIARLHAANAQRRAAYNYDVALTRKAGDQANLTLIPDIEAWAKQVEEIFRNVGEAEKVHKAEVLATQTTLDTKAEALAQIAQTLATLAKDDSASDRVRFLAGYARQLASEVKSQADQDTQSAKAAKQLLTTVQNSLGGSGQ
jgi:hypothetical protein